MLLAVRLTDLERRAIGQRLSGRPLAVTNRSASRFLHDELHRVLGDLVLEYRESIRTEHGEQDSGLLVSKGSSAVWHQPRERPERAIDGWRCSTVCDKREELFDRAMLSVDGGEVERLCIKCLRISDQDRGTTT